LFCAHRFIATVALSILIFGTASACSAKVDPRVQGIELPEGFRIAIYSSEVPNARSMTLGDEGTLFVGTRRAGNVYAVVDRDGDQLADEVFTIANGLNMPNGVAFRDGSLYVAEVNRILRFDEIESNLADPPEPVVVTDSYPSDTHHGWKFIRFGPDGKLYVPVGAPCNICEPDEIYASITRIDADGSNREIYASGIRNTVGFDWHPQTGELWFTDNGRDWLGNDLPPDELNSVSKAGLHFGYPYCHGGDLADPEFGKKRPCADTVSPQVKMGSHVAALGMRFYTGSMFPPPYKNRIFIAEHGSWNRENKIGYRITTVVPGNKDFEVFASGWLAGDEVSGRPVDVQVMPDGALLVSDDLTGTIYRIDYTSDR